MRRLSLYLGTGLVALVVLTGLVSLVWTPFDPTRVDPAHTFAPPGGGHLLGTDNNGSDLLSRLMAGSRICLVVGVVSVAIAACVGVPLGLVAGMAQGWIARTPVRASDLLYAFPALLLAILLAAARGGSTLTGMVAIGISTVPVFVRITRAGALQTMSQDFVSAARSSGIGWARIARTHVLPNIAPLLGVQASVSFATAILAEAALSYLGLATPPGVPTWGRMLFDGRIFLFNHPELVLLPAAAIALAVLGFNLLGDGLRDLLDPRLREVA